MTTKLENMKLTSVDLVRAGANQMADIVLFKSAGPQAEFDEALVKSARSILEDPDLEEDQRAGMLAKSVDDYRAALEEPEEDEPESEEVMVEKEPEEEEPADLDEIEEVEKDYDTIEEVQKFNPFHDALGRFASSNSFRTYSANPKSKAGAMAIGRSARAGHTSTMNVHRESKGENVGQNYTWLQTGQKPAFLTGGAGTQQTPPSPPTPKKRKKPQPTQQAQPQPTQANSGHTMVSGKDISKTFKPDPNSTDSIPQQIAAKQGYPGKPRVVSSPAYDQASMASGYTAFRTIKPGSDVKTGVRTTAKDFANTLLYGDASQRSLNGTGGQAFGAGMYFAKSPGNSNGFAVSPQAAGIAHTHSTTWYGRKGRSAVVEATMDPSAKVGKYTTLKNKWDKLSLKNKQRFGDVGGYAMALGYDAIIEPKANGSNCDYLMVYNMTKVVARDVIGKY